MDSEEEWRDIPGRPGYQVSDANQARSFWKAAGKGKGFKIGDTPRLLKVKKDRWGYWVVNSRGLGNRSGRARVHILVLEAFVGPRPPGMHGRHLDDDKDNNHPSNLAWGTPKENMRDKYRNGYRSVRGEAHGLAKLTDEKVREIRRLRANGLTQQAISDATGVPQTTISRVCTGYSWSHV